MRQKVKQPASISTITAINEASHVDDEAQAGDRGGVVTAVGKGRFNGRGIEEEDDPPIVLAHRAGRCSEGKDHA